jgi:acetyl-CoA carboxylase biotin carboxyl carrier protein
VGDRVEPGTVLGYAEAMKMRTEITADTGGEIVEVLVTDQQPVQFNAPLFLLRPDAR